MSLGSFFPLRLRPLALAPPPGACPFGGGAFRAGGDGAGARGCVERPGRAALLAGRLDRAGRPHLLQPPGQHQNRHRYRQRGLRSPPGAEGGMTRPRFRRGRARPARVVSGAGLTGGWGLLGRGLLGAAKGGRRDPPGSSPGPTAFRGRGRQHWVLPPLGHSGLCGCLRSGRLSDPGVRPRQSLLEEETSRVDGRSSCFVSGHRNGDQTLPACCLFFALWEWFKAVLEEDSA